MYQAMKQNKYFLALLFFFLAPATAGAQVAAVTFTSQSQTVEPNVSSLALTLAAQDVNGNPVSGGIPQTGCIALTSSSQTGQFSSSAATWNPTGVLTMNKGTSNRSFFYKDPIAGTYNLSVAFALKPTTVSDSCSSWPQSEWGTLFHASQTIIVGAQSSDTTSSDQTSADNDTTSSTTATQETTSISQASVGSETLVTKIKTQPVVIAGAGSFFSGSASDSHGSKGSGTRYVWNFGDGAIEEGQTVFHTYTYPGTYAVLLSVGSGDEAGIGRTSIQVMSAQIGMLVEPDGSVLISNQSSQELNIGLWNVTSGTSTFPIPQNTILLGSQSIRFSSEVMHMYAGTDVVLRYPNNTIVSVTSPAQKNSSTEPAQNRPIGSSEPRPGFAPASAASSATQASRPRSAEADSRGLPQETQDTQINSAQPTSSALIAAAEAPIWSFKTMTPFLPYALGTLGIILIGVGLFLRKNPMKRVTNRAADEFDIEG
jgi:hypothetical protein